MGLVSFAARLLENESVKRTLHAVREFVLGKLQIARSVDDVLKAERDAIGVAREARGLTPPPAMPNPPDYVGLAFSGGGIRSATFNLGIVQGLARYGLLPHIDYLSTVSGGGYIGSWLVAWIKRQAEREDATSATAPPSPAAASGSGSAQATDPENRNARNALERVQELLRPDQADPDSLELEPIRNLRRYSNYLTPSASVFSADTWALVAIWFRNTLLNLLIIVSLIAVVLLLPRFVGLWLKAWRDTTMQVWSWSFEGALSCVAMLVSSIAISFNLRRVSRRARQEERKAAGEKIKVDNTTTHDQALVQGLILVPATIGAAAVAFWIFRTPTYLVEHWSSVITLVLSFGFSVITCVGGFPAGFAARLARLTTPPLKWRVVAYATGVVLSIAVGFVTAAMLYGVTRGFHALGALRDPDGGSWLLWIVGAFGPPAVLVVSALGLALLVGLVGRDMPDPSREWLGRLRAWSIIYGGIWALVFAVAFFGPWLLYRIGVWATAGAGLTWLGTTIAGLYAGNSERTAGTGAKRLADVSKETVAIVAPYVFMAGVFILVSLGIHELVSTKVRTDLTHAPGPTATLAGTPDTVTLTVGAREGKRYNHFEARLHTYASDLASATQGVWVGFSHLDNVDLYNLTMLLLTAVVAGAILAWRVDINEFSMHHFYKNRLVRCYLGASRRHRKPDAFTGFDGGDDYPLACLQPPSGKNILQGTAFTRDVYCGPYPIINATLNISGGNALAWQERQAVSYVFTPLFSGFDKPLVDRESGEPATIPPQKKTDAQKQRHAFRPTDQCGYIGGICVGQAMAISGAAASPNSGYHTSTAVAFFLTVLNARLGWWLGNPALKDYYTKSSPEIGLPYLLVELFGLANARRKYVNLSDGGHFDNLGIYELVRRRCRYVIACDGEQDGDMTFGGLANVIRKCRTDFGAVIEINVERLRTNGDRLSPAHVAVGTITYDNGQVGRLVYLKSSLTGNEDADVLEYRARNRLFPHQSTGDQWFDESQFESYRRLGLHVAESAFGGIETLSRRAGTDYAVDKQEFFEDVELKHYPPSKLIEQAFTRHTELLTDRLEMFAKNARFQTFDDSVFSQWTSTGIVAKDREFERAVRYWCNSIIQLMENAYVDLDLDDPKELQHPDNAGWLLLFRRWAVTPVFSRTWSIVRSTYGARFQRFFERLQALEADRLMGWWECDRTAPALPGFPVAKLKLTCARSNGHWELEGSIIDPSDHETPMHDLDFNGSRLMFRSSLGGPLYRLTLEDAAEPRSATVAVNDQPSQALAFTRVRYVERQVTCY